MNMIPREKEPSDAAGGDGGGYEMIETKNIFLFAKKQRTPGSFFSFSDMIRVN
jgi:hypothetical protein